MYLPISYYFSNDLFIKEQSEILPFFHTCVNKPWHTMIYLTRHLTLPQIQVNKLMVGKTLINQIITDQIQFYNCYHNNCGQVNS